MKFLESEDIDVDLDSAKVVILPIPYDATSTYQKGADLGPHALLHASSQLELYDDELDLDPWRIGIHTAPVQSLPREPEAMVKKATARALTYLQMGKKILGVGGEHSVSWPLISALKQRAKGEFGILQIDAHLDLRDEYEGSPFNHACVMKRASDQGIPIFPVGIRAVSREEMGVAKERGIQPIMGRDLGLNSRWMEELVDRLPDQVYVTFDLDGLDPSVLPSTGTPVPGGLGWYECLALLRMVGDQKEVIGADIVELKPDPIQHRSEFLAALLAYKMIGYFWAATEIA